MSESFDIAVVGAGAAGIAAAIAAARAGCATLLLDARPAAGGTGGFSGLTTLCGLFDSKANWLNAGFAREFAELLGPSAPLRMGKVWVLPYRPEKFRESAAALLASMPRLQTRWHNPLAAAVVERDRIVSVNGLRVGAVIDCSGNAEVARMIGADSLATDETTQASAIVFRLDHVAHALDTPASVLQVLLPVTRAGLPWLNFQPTLEPGVVTVKLTGQPEQARQVVEFLQTQVEGFESCRMLGEFNLAKRAGRMIVGQYILTGGDVLAGRKFSDAAARGAWPIEQWNARGEPRLRYLADGAHYEIPARSLRAAKTQNLFMGGKTISADVDGIASARVMGCCLATGAAAGNLAADWLASPDKT